MINLELPDDCQSYVRQYQGAVKSKKEVGFYSLQKCIIAIIREHKALTEGNKDQQSGTPEAANEKT
jgi:hypothetical protein